MSNYLATKTSIADWIKGLASGNSVYFPAKHGQSSYRFTRVQSDSEIQFEHYTPTVVPPVKLLLPAREELLQFRKNADGKSEVSASLDTSFRVLAGVRPMNVYVTVALSAKSGMFVVGMYRRSVMILSWVCASL